MKNKTHNIKCKTRNREHKAYNIKQGTMKHIAHNMEHKTEENTMLQAPSSKLHEKGVTIYLAMLLLSAALATALFVSNVFVTEFKISKEVTDSMKAVYVADSAMEYTLYRTRILDDYSVFVPNSSSSGLIPLSNGGTVYELSTSGCVSLVGLTGLNTGCTIEAVSDLDKNAGIPGCPSTSSAPDCTYVISKGQYGDTNRALEIVYENK